MSKNSSHRDPESARAERRRAHREWLRGAAQELLSSQGWARWVRVRSMFHAYSAGNCMLLAHQCHERGIVPQRIGGFRTWLTLGRCVRKGETALRIFAPLTVSERDERGQETGERRVFFKTAFVFELSQTEPLPGAEVLPLEPPSQPLSGDSHAHMIEPLRFLANSIGFSVSFQSIAGAAGGWCEPKGRRIVIDADAPANAQVRTLIHECAHALGIDYHHYTRPQAEVIVDTAAFIVSAAAGLDVAGESVPYVAGWGEDGALAAVSEFAETIDRIARRIEAALPSPAGASVKDDCPEAGTPLTLTAC